MGAKKQTVGFRYLWTLQMGLCRGPVNSIADITVGGISVLNGDEEICLDESGQLYLINKPELFGGDEKEGGVKGPIYFYNGASDQVLQGAVNTAVGTLPDIETALGGDVPNFRGVVTAWFDGLITTLNPYPKEWAFRIRRTSAGWHNNAPFYPFRATITLQSESGGLIRAMNGSHILYEINTNPEWGRGMPADLIDENSYIYAANQLCQEGLGICLPWFRQETIKEFIPQVINHIGGVQYVDRTTGKMTLRLIRDDYDPDTLPVFAPGTGLLRIEEDDASSEETAYNEIVVKGFDPTTKEEIAVTVQNLASIQSLGEIISNTIVYKGIPTRALLGRIAERELGVQQGLRKFSCVFDRRAYKLAPGMPFKIAHPGKGIAEIIVRAGEIRERPVANGNNEIEMSVIQDVFAMPDASYIEPPGRIWTPPNFEAAPALESRLLEVNWRDYYIRSEAADRDAVDANTSFIATVARPPAGVATQGYDLATKATGEDYVNQTRGGFTARTALAANVAPLDTAMTFVGDLAAFSAEFNAGDVILIDDEQMSLLTFDSVTGAATVKRGVADTIPAAHLADASVWLVDDEMVSDGREYVDGETVNAKVLTRTATDLLDLADATELTVETNQRLFRPYPPGNVQVDAISIYAPRGEAPEPVLTWTHRDRLVQADTAVGHEEGSVGPETGVEYRIRIYAEDNVTLLNTYDVGTVDTWTYLAVDQGTDGAGNLVFMEMVSVRDGLESTFPYRFQVVLNGGWGYGYGLNYGGA